MWYAPAATATAVRPVPRSIAVDEGALVSVLLPPSPNCPMSPIPQHFRSPLSRMAQVWYLQQTPQRPFGPCRGQSLWMKVRWCPCCFHHRPTAPSMLAVKLLAPEPPVSRTSVLWSSVSSSLVHTFSVSRKPAWVINIIRKERMTAFESWPLLTLRIMRGRRVGG